MGFLGILLIMKIVRFLPGNKLILLPVECQPAVTEHFQGAIAHNKHLFGKFFSLMGLEDLTSNESCVWHLLLCYRPGTVVVLNK